jgi:branched-chain amino acid transport system substrate-binding protein
VPPENMANAKDFVTRFTAKYGPIQVYAPYSYDGVTAKIEFDEHGDTKNGAITLYQVKDGKLVPLAMNVGGKTEKVAADTGAPAASPAPAAGTSDMKASTGAMKSDMKAPDAMKAMPAPDTMKKDKAQ